MVGQRVWYTVIMQVDSSIMLSTIKKNSSHVLQGLIALKKDKDSYLKYFPRCHANSISQPGFSLVCFTRFSCDKINNTTRPYQVSLLYTLHDQIHQNIILEGKNSHWLKLYQSSHKWAFSFIYIFSIT